MRITIATGPWLPIPAVQGGSVPRMWHGLAEQFAARGHEVTLLARSFPGQICSETVRGVRYFRWGGFSQSRSIGWDLAKDAFYAVGLLPRLPKADIFVINDFWLPAFASLTGGGTGAIVINANRFPKGQYWMYRRAALIAAASTAVKEAISLQCPALKARITVLPNPLDTDAFWLKPGPPRDAGRKTVLYVGRIHPEKGVHVLLKAFAIMCRKNAGLKLRLVGPVAEKQGGGGGVYQTELRSIASDLPVCFDDPIFDVEELAQVYREADVFCYPSLAEKGEALPVAPLEAMATGLAPVVSNLDCFKDFITDGKTGWYFDHRRADPAAALAEKLDQVLSDPARCTAVELRAAEAARHYSFSNVADMFLRSLTTLGRRAAQEG